MKELYTVASIGTVDNINAPVSTPIEIPFTTVSKMIKSGFEVYQHNPLNLSEKVRVTLNNIGRCSFKPYCLSVAEKLQQKVKPVNTVTEKTDVDKITVYPKDDEPVTEVVDTEENDGDVKVTIKDKTNDKKSKKTKVTNDFK